MKESSLRRWLLASLVLNLFLAGGIAGGAWRWWQAGEAPGLASAAAAPTRGLRAAADGLAPEQRQAFRAGLREARRDAAATLQAARQGRQRMMQLLAAPEFDRAAAAATLARIREADTLSRARYEATVVDFAATLQAADREKLAEGLARRGGTSPARTAPPGPAPVPAPER
jgi:uncharacterized membrane protein